LLRYLLRLLNGLVSLSERLLQFLNLPLLRCQGLSQSLDVGGCHSRFGRLGRRFTAFWAGGRRLREKERSR
jgi:hypothetical protein